MANWWRCSAAATRRLRRILLRRAGTIRDIIEPRGATIVGHWPTAGYHFEASKGPADDDHFVGLAIDEDRQPELTNERVEKWVKQVAEELHLEEIKNA